MKLPPFDHSKMRWDAWQAFHVDHLHGRFIQFDTGEFVVCSYSWRPDQRRTYGELGLQVVATDDKDCPQLYAPGVISVIGAKPIPKTHLGHHGQQMLLLDLPNRRAVGLGGMLDKDAWPTIPERFTDCYSRIVAYYSGPEAMPIGAPITQHHPHPLTPGERTHIRELIDACKVWLQMQPNPDELKNKHRNAKVLPVGDFVDVSFSALTTEHRMAIAVRDGFNMIVKKTHPWLTFNLEGN
jgi:hypothetical protein